MVIGAQNGPTSALKRDPPGFMGTLGQSRLLLAADLLALVGWDRFGVRSLRRAKRRWALRGRNPPRDNSADGVPMALLGPQRLCLLGLFTPPSDTRVDASENPGGLGAEPPGQTTPIGSTLL